MRGLAIWGLAISGQAFLVAGPVLAAAPLDLSRLSLEDLSNIEVTSVSKRPERLAEAAASIYVISNDDVRRSGVHSLAEALRLAPNLNVQRVDALDYGISARGLNGFESSNKLLVLIDGRSVYSPFYAGVEWSQLHPDLTDLDRIEVISGPGGALWGSNAVNGVVNVVSRPADLTQGVAVTLSASTVSVFGTGRYGGRLGEAGAYRVYVRGYERGASRRVGGGDAGDDWRGGQIGFRADLGAGADRVTLQGDAYHDDVASLAPTRPDGKLEGGNVLARWTRSTGETSEFEVQAYYDRYERRARGILDGVITYDLQAQQRLILGRHKLVFGAGYRRWSDKFDNYVNGFVLDPPRDRNDLTNAFVQDQITLGDVTVTLGVKAEHSSFSGSEWLPSGRIAWRAGDTALLWAAVSRAVRNPSRLDRDLVFRPFLERSDFEPEELIAYELGYRGRPTPRLSLSATLFYHDYEKVRSNEPAPGGVFPLRIGNGLEGETWGLEAWGEYELGEAWRVSAGGSTLGKDFRIAPGSRDRSNLAAAGHDPDLQLFLRTQGRLSERMDLDLRLRHVARVPARTAGSLRVPAYTELDARMSWRLTERVELSLAGFNLLDASHPEATEPRRTEMRRSVQVALRYGW
jgi:iron complex outermembrane receptor protein